MKGLTRKIAEKAAAVAIAGGLVLVGLTAAPASALTIGGAFGYGIRNAVCDPNGAFGHGAIVANSYQYEYRTLPFQASKFKTDYVRQRTLAQRWDPNSSTWYNVQNAGNPTGWAKYAYPNQTATSNGTYYFHWWPSSVGTNFRYDPPFAGAYYRVIRQYQWMDDAPLIDIPIMTASETSGYCWAR